MPYTSVPVIGFAAPSGTGKTTLLTQLIPALKQQGVRTAIIKHSHHDFEIDQPGKDSFRLRAAGASPVILVSRYRQAIITEFSTRQEPRLEDQLKALDQTQLDLILVEGFKDARFPKIELHRQNLSPSLLYPDDPYIIAVASDTQLILPTHITLLDINNMTSCINFILQFIQSHPFSQMLSL